MSESPRFNVAQLLKEPIGAVRNVYIDADLRQLVPDLDIEQAENEPEVRLTGPVRLMHITDSVLAQGALTGKITQPCVRCLEPVEVSLDVEIEETFSPTVDIVTGHPMKPEEEDKALWIDPHHILDMTEVLRQALLLTIPVHVVCREDCRGLCSTCGKNLNEGDCDCVTEPDPRWAALSDLLKNDESEET